MLLGRMLCRVDFRGCALCPSAAGSPLCAICQTSARSGPSPLAGHRSSCHSCCWSRPEKGRRDKRDTRSAIFSDALNSTPSGATADHRSAAGQACQSGSTNEPGASCTDSINRRSLLSLLQRRHLRSLLPLIVPALLVTSGRFGLTRHNLRSAPRRILTHLQPRRSEGRKSHGSAEGTDSASSALYSSPRTPSAATMLCKLGFDRACCRSSAVTQTGRDHSAAASRTANMSSPRTATATPPARSADDRVWLAAKIVGGAAISALVAALAWRLYRSRRSASSAADRAIVITESTRQLFQSWEAFKAARVGGGDPVPVVTDDWIRSRVWAVYHVAMEAHAYRCIEERRFMESRVALHPLWNAITGANIPSAEEAALKGASVEACTLPAALAAIPVSERRLLDIGCCFGTDLRSLIIGGFTPENVLGLDIQTTFIDLGLDHLFRDRALMQSRFCTGDILDRECVTRTPVLARFLRATIGATGVHIAYAGSVFHLLSLPDTLRLSEALFRVLLPGGVAMGRTVGLLAEVDASVQSQRGSTQLRFLHTAASLQAQLESVGFTHVHITSSVVDMPDGSAEKRSDLAKRTGRKSMPLGNTTTLLSFSAVKPAQ